MERINYFKRYSTLGDDRFFVSPCTLPCLKNMKLHSCFWANMKLHDCYFNHCGTNLLSIGTKKTTFKSYLIKKEREIW